MSAYVVAPAAQDDLLVFFFDGDKSHKVRHKIDLVGDRFGQIVLLLIVFCPISTQSQTNYSVR